MSNLIDRKVKKKKKTLVNWAYEYIRIIVNILYIFSISTHKKKSVSES